MTLKNIHLHLFGKCNICGRPTIFLCLDVISARNNMVCIYCRSSSRKRHVANIVIKMIFNDKKISSIKDIPKFKDKFIYNTASNDALSMVLKNYISYICSELLPNVKPGTQIGERVFCQNLENLTFSDDSFDIIITEDVFEHVRDHIKGFREIHRVLKDGGFHVFTVPCNFDRPTLIRVDTNTDKDIMLLPPEYHGDYLRGSILAYRTFGIDLFDLLKSLNYITRVYFSRYDDLRFGIVEGYVFMSQKVKSGDPIQNDNRL